jgi:hypothetical protein
VLTEGFATLLLMAVEPVGDTLVRVDVTVMALLALPLTYGPLMMVPLFGVSTF